MTWYSVQAGIGDQMHFECTTTMDGGIRSQRTAVERIFKRILAGGQPLNAPLTGDTRGAFKKPGFKPTWARVLSQGDRVIEGFVFGPCPLDLQLPWKPIPETAGPPRKQAAPRSLRAIKREQVGKLYAARYALEHLNATQWSERDIRIRDRTIWSLEQLIQIICNTGDSL